MSTTWTAPPTAQSSVPRQRGVSSIVPAGPGLSPDAEDVVAVLADGAVRTLLQPVVDLRTQAVVAHEALLRGPTGTALETPLALLSGARDAGLAAALDLAAVGAHLAHAAASFTSMRGQLFVNLEPSTLNADLEGVLYVLGRRPPGLGLVVEFTERALAADPAGILAAARRLRGAGCAIALDDVGADPASLAFMPLLRPEVVKLDLELLRTVEDIDTITVALAVRAYAERTGAEVVAEGIETEEDRLRALVLGATLGQGWLWGRPTAEPRPVPSGGRRIAPAPAGQAASGTPFGLVTPRSADAGPTELLGAVSRGLERAAGQSRVPPVLLSTFQHASRFGPPTARRYADLARDLPLVGVFGAEMPAEPAPGVRGVLLAPGDPLCQEWSVVVLGAHDVVALLARERLGPAAEAHRRWFDFVVTHDRERVTEAALRLVERLGGVRGATRVPDGPGTFGPNVP